jgi:hypothetical protein
MLFHRQRHRSRRLADRKHQRAAIRRRRQLRREDLERIGRGDRGAKARFE